MWIWIFPRFWRSIPAATRAMAVTQTRDLGINLSLDELAPALVNQLNQQLEQA